jgi:hypothetical protein
MTRYRFLLTKRYPHPSGPKRPAGTEYPIDPATAAAWLRAGIIEPVDPPKPPRKRVSRKRE